MTRILFLASLLLAFAAPAMAQETPPASETAAEATPPAEPTAEPPVAPQPEAAPAAPVWTGPTVTLQTTMGDITITLDTVGAPKTSAQFLGLVKSGHYNGASFR